VNFGDEAMTSEYKKTGDSRESFQNLLLQLPSALPCARWCCWSGALARFTPATS